MIDDQIEAIDGTPVVGLEGTCLKVLIDSVMLCGSIAADVEYQERRDYRKRRRCCAMTNRMKSSLGRA